MSHKVVNMIREESFQFTIHKTVHSSSWQECYTTLANYKLFIFQKQSIPFQNKVAQNQLALLHEAYPKFPLVPMQPAKHEKSREPWRLTSHPRPQRGHPRAWGNKVWPVAQNKPHYITITTHTTLNNTSKSTSQPKV